MEPGADFEIRPDERDKKEKDVNSKSQNIHKTNLLSTSQLINWQNEQTNTKTLNELN